MDEFDADNLPPSSFQTYNAEGDQLAKQGNFKQAIESYSKALLLRPNDKTCLVFRSKCYLLMGDSDSALADANASLKDDKTFFKGIFQKAEALYATGDFEMALVYYHRGNKLRPEFNDFRLGIQKASEAIDNSIGSKIIVPSPNLLRRKDPRDYKIRSGTSSNPKSEKTTDIIGVTRAQKGGESAIPKEKKGHEAKVKQLLGELHVDRIYLENLLVDKDFISNPNEEVMDIVKKALEYLESRTEFWQQQKPIYARKKDFSNIQVKTQSAKIRRDTQQKTKEKVAQEKGLKNPTQKQIRMVDFEQKNIKAGIKSIYKSLEKKDFSAAIESTQNLLLRLGQVENQTQKYQAMAECYSILGITHLEIGGFAQAVLYHKKDLSISSEQNFSDGYKRACVNLARAYIVLKRFKEAAKMFQDRLAAVQNDERSPADYYAERAWLLHDISRCFVEAGMLNEALSSAEESSSEAEKSKEKHWILNTKVLVARLQAKLEKANEAHSIYHEAFLVAKELGDHGTRNAILEEMLMIEKAEEFKGDKVATELSAEIAAAVRIVSSTKSSSKKYRDTGKQSSDRNVKELLTT